MNKLLPVIIAVLLLSCTDEGYYRQVYTDSEKASFQPGDTIYVRFGGDITIGIVERNDPQKKMIILKRKLLNANDLYLKEVWDYSRLP